MLLHTFYGSCHTEVLPDTGADVSAAGEHILSQLNEHKDNLLPSEFTPHVANYVHAVGKMQVCFQLTSVECEEDVYIFTH